MSRRRRASPTRREPFSISVGSLTLHVATAVHVLPSLAAGAEGVPGQGPAGSHPGEGGQLGHGPGLDGRPQRGRETEDGCED